MEDYYKAFGINSDSTIDEIKNAYTKLVKFHSPEKDPEEFQKIRLIYETLSDKDKRAEYDIYYNEKYKLKEEKNKQSKFDKKEHGITIPPTIEEDDSSKKILVIILFLIVIILGLICFAIYKLGNISQDYINNNQSEISNEEIAIDQDYSNNNQSQIANDEIVSEQENNTENKESDRDLIDNNSSTSILNYIDDSYLNYEIYYNIYTNAYLKNEEAEKEVNELVKKGLNSEIVNEYNYDGNKYYKVLVGRSHNLTSAIEIKDELKYLGYGDIYILAYDKNLERELDNIEEYIEQGNYILAEDNLNNIKSVVTQNCYERYKERFDNLEEAINLNTTTNIVFEDYEIYDTIDTLQNQYEIAVQQGNPDLMNDYVIIDSDIYNSYHKNIPRYYEDGILVYPLSFNIYGISINNNKEYVLDIEIQYKIINSNGERIQRERANYVFKLNEYENRLLLDRMENWNIIE